MLHEIEERLVVINKSQRTGCILHCLLFWAGFSILKKKKKKKKKD